MIDQPTIDRILDAVQIVDIVSDFVTLRKRGVRDISACVIVASPEGVQAVLEHDPSVRLFTCAIDEGLNEDAYIVPGLGDAGDRIFRTEGTPVQSELA